MAPDQQTEGKMGHLSLDLIATVGGRFSDSPRDGIAGGPALSTWLASAGLPTAAPPTSGDVTRFQNLREAVFRLATAASGQTSSSPPGNDDIALLNHYAQGRDVLVQLRPMPDLRGPGSLTAVSLPVTATQALATIARDAINLLGGPSVRQLRQCQADPCGTFFLDTSRAGQRRWCSSATCGNRVRVAAHRKQPPRNSGTNQAEELT